MINVATKSLNFQFKFLFIKVSEVKRPSPNIVKTLAKFLWLLYLPSLQNLSAPAAVVTRLQPLCPRARPRELDHCAEAGPRLCYYTIQYTVMLQTGDSRWSSRCCWQVRWTTVIFISVDMVRGSQCDFSAFLVRPSLGGWAKVSIVKEFIRKDGAGWLLKF